MFLVITDPENVLIEANKNNKYFKGVIFIITMTQIRNELYCICKQIYPGCQSSPSPEAIPMSS